MLNSATGFRYLGFLFALVHPCVTKHWEYCIVGAGPGGIQMGQYLLNRNRSYVIFEKEATAGSFFEKYPSHRQLISLNKRFTGRSSTGFNLRHDWNSLIGGTAAIKPMTERSESYYPHADVLAEYLREFAEEQAQHIHYKNAVTRVAKTSSSFELTLESPTGSQIATCDIVLMAQGIRVPNIPKIGGLAENAIGYENLWQEKYAVNPEGGMWLKKNVAILGAGNAALETADAVAPHANLVHIFGRNEGSPKFSWETHYVGSIRAIRMHHFDRYLLKSIDAFDLPAGYQAEADRMHILDCTLPTDDHPKKCMFKLSASKVGGKVVNGSTVYLGWWNSSDPMQQELKKELGPKFRIWKEQTNYNANYEWDIDWVWMMTKDFLERPDLMRYWRHMLETSWRGNFAARPYDYVVRCQGWKQNVSVYDKTAFPQMQANGKYAEMNSRYESVNVSGLYFIGTLGHGKDFRKASGGFIHGFRYTARALDRMLEVERHDGMWPRLRSFSLPHTTASAITHEIAHRLQNADGSYQMFNKLGDAVVFCRASSDDSASIMAYYLEELPVDYFHEHFYSAPRIWWVFKYQQEFNPVIQVAERGTTFMPHLYLFLASKKKPKSEPIGKQKSDYVIPENQHTDFNHNTDVHFLNKWVTEILEWVKAKDRVKQTCEDFAPIRHAVAKSKLCADPARCEYDSDLLGSTCKADAGMEQCKKF